MRLIKRILNDIALLIYKGRSDGNKIALTFDDGPYRDHTKYLCDLLDKEDIKATFFVSGKEAEKNPDLIKLMMENGHEVANHSYIHKRNFNIIAGLKRTEEIIKNILGYSSRLFRPPWGKVTIKLIFYCIFKNIKVVLWSFDSMDFKYNDARELYEYIKSSKIIPGSILLFHEDYVHTMEALPDIIRNFKNRGLNFCTVSKLIK